MKHATLNKTATKIDRQKQAELALQMIETARRRDQSLIRLTYDFHLSFEVLAGRVFSEEVMKMHLEKPEFTKGQEDWGLASTGPLDNETLKAIALFDLNRMIDSLYRRSCDQFKPWVALAFRQVELMNGDYRDNGHFEGCECLAFRFLESADVPIQLHRASLEMEQRLAVSP
jgi:hypothetical protein